MYYAFQGPLTARPYKSQPQNAGQSSHDEHRQLPLPQWHTSGFWKYWHYLLPCGFDTMISKKTL